MLTTQTLDEVHAEALRARLSGDLILPGESNWDEARQAWNLVTPRTIEVHLGHAFEKLGIRSRRELSTALTR